MSVAPAPIFQSQALSGVALISSSRRSSAGASKVITFTRIFPEQQRDTHVSRQEWCFGFESDRWYVTVRVNMRMEVN
jgi:hypothetical protein